MKRNGIRPSPVPFIALGLLAVGTSGCRFGNQVVASTSSSTDGYYETAPTALKYSTNLHTGYTEGDATQVPSLIAGVMTNPVVLYYVAEAQAYGLYANDLQRVFQVGLTGNQMSTNLAGSEAAFFRSTDCGRTRTIEMSGSYSRYAEPHTTAQGVTALGRISADYTVIESLTGNCAQTMLEVVACIADASQCYGDSNQANLDNQAYFAALLGPYITSGAITAQELPDLRSFGYQVSYR